MFARRAACARRAARDGVGGPFLNAAGKALDVAATKNLDNAARDGLEDAEAAHDVFAAERACFQAMAHRRRDETKVVDSARSHLSAAAKHLQVARKALAGAGVVSSDLLPAAAAALAGAFEKAKKFSDASAKRRPEDRAALSGLAIEFDDAVKDAEAKADAFGADAEILVSTKVEKERAAAAAGDERLRAFAARQDAATLKAAPVLKATLHTTAPTNAKETTRGGCPTDGAVAAAAATATETLKAAAMAVEAANASVGHAGRVVSQASRAPLLNETFRQNFEGTPRRSAASTAPTRPPRPTTRCYPRRSRWTRLNRSSRRALSRARRPRELCRRSSAAGDRGRPMRERGGPHR